MGKDSDENDGNIEEEGEEEAANLAESVVELLSRPGLESACPSLSACPPLSAFLAAFIGAGIGSAFLLANGGDDYKEKKKNEEVEEEGEEEDEGEDEERDEKLN